ncbi:LamG-like jellyroll fold domain-containing protein [Asticcacaulis sp. YBE204]|uniref:LamG-like jellyroll fold domain-containing protein n=1 Tax=Asticcacaulis sp. YBE204 TaxID=1282363 RepID=UPI0004CDF276|nr:LamG-like jellyroll fold domain-containing protein [Asticcacaulis sp. YBE204]
MSRLDRRQVMVAGAAVAGSASVAAAMEPMKPQTKAKVWTFDRLDRIGGLTPRVQGNPVVIDSPQGKAVQFDGVDDALFFDEHPLAGAKTFAFEAIFRPDGGVFEQRWFHLAEVDPKADPKVVPNGTRFLFEIRVVEDKWYLDTFVTGPGYKQTLIFPEKLFPVGQWYHVAQTYDGTAYRAYVDGVLQGEAAIAFTPQGPGRSSAGIRLNGVNPFKGAIATARFTPSFVPHEKFLKLRK